jgi:Uma2 family endonuclease
LPQPGTAAWDEFWQLAPDLVVQVVSPSESRPKMEERARQWLAAGVQLVWLIWPKAKQVEVWRPGAAKPVQTLGVSDMLDGLDVVPGFTYPVARLFR